MYTLQGSNYIKWRKKKIFTKEIKDPDLNFYVIRRTTTPTTGLFSNYIYALNHIQYAIQNGYIPIVDFQTYPNSYLYPNEVGIINSWEYYFDQPMKYNLDYIKNCKNVFFSNGVYLKARRPLGNIPEFFKSDSNRQYWHEIAARYVRMNENTMHYIENEYSKLFDCEKKILGVHCRGTGYSPKVSKNLAAQPNVKDIIEKAKEIYKKYSCDLIFCTTEDPYIFQEFKNAFQDILITRESVKYEYDIVEDQMIPIENYNINKYKEGLEYLTDMYLLSKCDCLVMGYTLGAVGVCIMSEGFEHSYFFDLGKYSDR